ncbi:MAG: tRNA pseudouridine(55) synthase, partial [Akkermansia sp.]
EVDFTVQCTKGFYVRSYAYDIGRLLGCGAHLSALRRTKSGDFSVENAVSVETLKTALREELYARFITLGQIARMRGI